MKTNRIYLPIIIAVSVAIGLLLGSKLNSSSSVYSGKNANKNKLNKLLDYIEREYVDAVNSDSIVDLTVTKILENLDPHSVYIDQKELVAVSESMQGDFVGIGVNFYLYNDTVAVIKPIKNGPSDKAGILAGDRILSANNYTLFGKQISNDTLFSKLKGEVGSLVHLEIYRKATNKKFKLNITRDRVPIKSVDIGLALTNKVGYIKINRFAETTYDEFKRELTALQTKGVETLIIDVRDNGGGYLERAVQIIDELLPNKALIVKTTNKQGKETLTYATENGSFEKGKVVVLINENSASASEILAGAIQDNDRGTIVGRRSFGKGLVQREMPLGDGSAIRLTVARYYTPSGRSIQKPYEDKAENYFNEFEKRFESGELYESDKTKIADSLKFKTKKGRIVYGGGGIIPDVFVPIEKNHNKEGLELLLQSEIMSYYAFEKLDENRAFFSKMNAVQLKNELFIKDKYFSQFKEYITSNGLLFNISNQKEQVLTYLYAEFSKQLFNDTSYYQIVLPGDKMIKKVFSLISPNLFIVRFCATSNLMRFLSQQHMPVVLLDHQHTGAHLFGKGVNWHLVVRQCQRCVCMPETVEHAVLLSLWVEQQVVLFQVPLQHMLKR